MGNSLGNVNLAQLAQKSLDALVPTLVPLQVVTTDFSDEVASSGATVGTRLPTQPTIVANLETLGYAGSAAAQTATAKTVTLGNLSGIVIGFTDTEWSKSSVNLYDIFVQPGVNTVAKGMQDTLWALFTNSNYSSKITSSAAAFNYAKVADLAEDCTDANMPAEGRALVLAPSYFTALSKDDGVKAAYAFGSNEVIRYRKIPSLAGFMPVIEYSALPANSENLKGIALNKQAAVVAARVPAVPANFPGEVQNVTDPDSGFTMQLRKWYSADDGKYYLSMAALWGASVGNGSAAIRVVSA
jgi:hypothetical protein